MQEPLENVLATGFFIAFAVPAYSYFVFPVMLYVLARLRAVPYTRSDEHTPAVTLIISAYNEASVIAEKV